MDDPTVLLHPPLPVPNLASNLAVLCADGDGLPSAPLASLSLRVPAPGAAAARSVPPRPAFAVKKPAGKEMAGILGSIRPTVLAMLCFHTTPDPIAGGVRPRKGSHGEGCASTSALPADNAYAALQEGGKLQLVRLLSALVAVAGRAVKQTATGNGKVCAWSGLLLA